MITNEELLNCNDAEVWARDFIRTVEENNISIDKDFMVTWFANSFYAQELQSANGIWNLLDNIVDVTVALSKDYLIINNKWVNKVTGEFLIDKGQEHLFSDIVKNGVDSYITNKIAYSGSKHSWFGFNLQNQEFREFTIGSKISYGEIGYNPSEPADLAKYYVEQSYAEAGDITIVSNGIIVKQFDDTVEVSVGRGEWVVDSIADARIMAIDYANDLE